jgi:hypothetical protein
MEEASKDTYTFKVLDIHDSGAIQARSGQGTYVVENVGVPLPRGGWEYFRKRFNHLPASPP